jgi:hypothetical protein
MMGKLKTMVTDLDQRGIFVEELVNYLINYEKGFPADIMKDYLEENKHLLTVKRTSDTIFSFVKDRKNENNRYTKYWNRVNDTILYKFMFRLYINNGYIKLINNKLIEITENKKNLIFSTPNKFFKMARDKYIATKYNNDKIISEEEFIAIITEPAGFYCINRQISLHAILSNMRRIFVLINFHNYNPKFVEHIRNFYIFILDEVLDDYLNDIITSNNKGDKRKNIPKGQLSFMNIKLGEYQDALNNIHFDTKKLFKNYFDALNWYAKNNNETLNMNWRMKHINYALRVHTFNDIIMLNDLYKKVYHFHDFLEVFIKGESVIKKETNMLIELLGGQ